MNKFFFNRPIVLSTFLFICLGASAQDTIKTTLNDDAKYFVEGLGTVTNTLSIWALATDVEFLVKDASGITLQTLTSTGNNFTFTRAINMATLPANARQIIAQFYDSGIPSGQSLPYTFTIIPKPMWMTPAIVAELFT